MRFRSLLSLVVVVPTLGAAVAIITSMYVDAQRRSGEMGQRLLLSATSQAVQQVEAHSKHAADLARTLASLGSGGLPLDDPDQLATSLLAVLKANTSVTWLSFSTPAGVFTGTYRDAENRLHINQSRIVEGKALLVEYVVAGAGTRSLVRRDADSGYDPRTRPFYLAATQSHGVAWSPPYVFYEQGVPGISCADPVYSPQGQLQGVFSVDYDLNRLSDLARQLLVSPNAEIMVFSADHVLVAHSAAKVVSGSDRRGSGKLMKLEDVDDPATRLVVQRLKSHELTSGHAQMSETVSVDQGGAPVLMCLTSVQLDSGPTEFVAAVAPVHDFAPGAWESGKGAILIALGISLAAAVVAAFLANRVSRPLLALVAASERIGGGDFDVQVELGSLYEFQHLTTAFHTMLAELKDWSRLRLSLQLAMEIQRSLLPGKTPRIPGFDIAGFSKYCDETGGDYYDFIVIDRVGPERLIIALGDVMGHGLPSALFMAGARGVLRSSISTRADPGALLTHMNDMLYHDTGGNRFMTMCLTDFDLKRSTAVWASAGHDAPLIYNVETGQFVDVEGGDVPLGVLEHVEYGNYPLGEFSERYILFIGSDGVWETFNPPGEQFGKERIKEIIAAHGGCSAEELKDRILAALIAFRRECPVKDDVTFVVIKTSVAERAVAVGVP